MVGDTLFKWLLATTYIAPLITLARHSSVVKTAMSAVRHSISGNDEEEEKHEPEATTELKLDSIEGSVLM